MTQVSPNERQVGGNHYARGGKFQHWDLIEEFGVGYLEGCATKYISRWRHKNGVEDLNKADHYIDKLLSLTNSGRGPRGEVLEYVLKRFCEDHGLGELETKCMYLLCRRWDRRDLILARSYIDMLIIAAQNGAQ